MCENQPKGSLQTFLETSKELQIIVDSSSEVKKETVESAVSERRRLLMNGHRKRFLHLKRMTKKKSKTHQFPRIIIHDKVFDSSTGYCYSVKNIITTLVDPSAVFEELCDEQEACFEKITVKDDVVEFYKYFEEENAEDAKSGEKGADEKGADEKGADEK